MFLDKEVLVASPLVLVIIIKTQWFMENNNSAPYKLCNTCRKIRNKFHENCQNDTEWIFRA